MKKKFIFAIVINISAWTLFCILNARNIHRPFDPLLARLDICYEGNTDIHTLANSHLQEHAIFHVFDEQHFFSHQLPAGTISYRYEPGRSVDAATLCQINERLLIEIWQGKRKYTDFTILKDRDFRKNRICGALILKYKKYPFVLKLFIENPESFTQPFSKGFEPTVFFLMGDGINRHLNGFTRLENLEFLKEQVALHPYWSTRVDFPRKWFWVPEELEWLVLTGHNIGGAGKVQQINIPAIYGVVCDEIQFERTFALNDIDDRTTILNLTNYLGHHIDPHIKNYVYEKGTNKIVPIDSEHFLTMVGLEEPGYCESYPEWYLTLTVKAVSDTYGRTKEVRRQHQFKSHEPSKPAA